MNRTLRFGTAMLLSIAMLPILARPASAEGTVVVQPGDTLHWIAMRNGTTADAMVDANGLGSADVIYVGQRLHVPGAGASTSSSSAQTSAADGATATEGLHTVRPGETLHRIALRYGVTDAQIAQANGLASPDLIVIGDQLRIPGGAQPGASPATGIQAAPAVHTIRGGDTLYRLALRYGTTVSAFQLANGLTGPEQVYLGQELKLPVGARGDAPAANTDAIEPVPLPEAETGASAPEVADEVVVPLPEPAVDAAPAAGGGGTRSVVVDLSNQSMIALEGETPVRWMTVSTGKALTPTPTGVFQIYSRYLSQHMYGPGYSLPGVPHVQYFTGAYAIHGTYWHTNFGTPTSHGCVNLNLADAEWFYDWSSFGTTVIVQD